MVSELKVVHTCKYNHPTNGSSMYTYTCYFMYNTVLTSVGIIGRYNNASLKYIKIIHQHPFKKRIAKIIKLILTINYYNTP